MTDREDTTVDDHDQRFKALLREFLPEFFDLFFPAWVARFDLAAAEFLEQEAFLDPPHGEKRVLDLVAKVPTRVPVPDPAGRGADHSLVVIDVEIESPERATDIRPRMLWYSEYLRRQHRLPVMPVCLFLRVGLDGRGWDAYEERLWNRTLLRFEYPYIGLPALPAEEYARGPNLLGLALSALMKLTTADRARFKADGPDRIARAGENEARKYMLAECFENYLELDPAEQQEFDRMESEKAAAEEVPTTGIAYRDYVTAQRRLVKKMLEKKFGGLTRKQYEEVTFMPPARIEQLALDLLDAKSLNELGLPAE